MDGQPVKEGVHFKGPVIDGSGRIVKKQLRLGQSESLLRLTEDFVFFTPAIPYICGVMSDRPLIDFIREYRCDVDFNYVKFNRPVFTGLNVGSNQDWNHVLWAIAREHWAVFLDFYCSLVLSVRARKAVFKIGLQSLRISDPLYLERKGLITGNTELLEVFAFGVNGSQLIFAFQQGKDPRTALPRVVRYNPQEEAKHYASDWFAGGNPLAYSDAIRAQQHMLEAERLLKEADRERRRQGKAV